MGNILKDINNSDLINPFDVVKGIINGETEVATISSIPKKSRDENVIISNLISNGTKDESISINKSYLLNPSFIGEPQYEPEYGEMTVTRGKVSEDSFIEETVKYLKSKPIEERLEIINKIKSLI
jgi:hypothetical protein